MDRFCAATYRLASPDRIESQMLISAYFDESSEGKAQAGILAVAGYVFTAARHRVFESRWGRMLAKYRLPYFHMSECNANSGEFARLTALECDDCARSAIKIARENTLHGAAYVLKQEDYRLVLQDKGFACDAYSCRLWSALLHMAKWRDNNRPNNDLHLHFEQGYSTQARAHELLQLVSQDPRFKQDVRMTRHAFFNKDASYQGQAADLLAWHVRKGYSNLAAEKAIRKDTLALIGGLSVKTIDFDRVQLTILRDQFVRHSSTLERASKILFNPDGPYLAAE